VKIEKILVIVTWLSKINLFPAVFSIVTAEVTKPPKINSVVFFIVTAESYVATKISSALFWAASM
jgi:hypothetical protein